MSQRGLTYGDGSTASDGLSRRDLPTVLEGIEAECRIQMSMIARHQVRGFDTQKARNRMLKKLDDDLDLYNLALSTDDW